MDNQAHSGRRKRRLVQSMIATLLSVATAGATTSVATAGATTSPLLDASPFGHALRKDFLFADNTTQFNHGSYGGIPRKVLDAQYEYVKALEQNVLQRIDSAWYRDRLIAVRKRLGEYINAPWEDVVLVDNASNAINVLLSMMWKFESDEVLLDFSTAYGPFKAYYEWLHATRGINTVAVDLHFPLSGPQPVLDALEKTLASIKASNKKVSVCVVSQVSSAPAVLLPIAEIVARLKKDGVPTIVDGAHALGATKIDVQAMGEPAFWFGNAHKWLVSVASGAPLANDCASLPRLAATRPRPYAQRARASHSPFCARRWWRWRTRAVRSTHLAPRVPCT